MRITVNGNERVLPAGLGAEASLEDILKEMAPAFQQEGMLVTSVILNQTDVTGKSSVEINNLGPVKDLVIRVSRPEELVVESLNITAEMVGPLRKDLAECADRLRIGDEANGTLILLRIIDNFQLLKMGVSHIGRIMKMQLPDVNAGAINEFVGIFEGKLDEIIEAQENRDLILLADLLEYEVGESLDAWTKRVTELSTSLCRVEA